MKPNTPENFPGAFIRALPDDPRVKRLLDSGASTYRKSGDPYLYIVPPGVPHSDAWRAVMGPLVYS